STGSSPWAVTARLAALSSSVTATYNVIQRRTLQPCGCPSRNLAEYSIMDERESSELPWRSCYLGMRIVIQSFNPPDPSEKLKQCFRFLGELARNETTLHDPQSIAANLDTETKRFFVGAGNKSVVSDSDLAQQIVSAMNGVGSGEEGPAAVLPLHADRIPLRVDEGGVVRVGHSRISLDLVVEQYENGMTPEDMVRAYDTLQLADVHAVIAYYLRHRDEVRAYLKRREEEANTLRGKIEAERSRVAREELIARRRAKEE